MADNGAPKANGSADITAAGAADAPKTAEDLKKECDELQAGIENEMDNTMLLRAQIQQNEMIEKTQHAIELRKFTQQIEEYEEMTEDIIDTLYDYEEKLELHGVFLEKSSAEAFEDAKIEVHNRAKKQNAGGVSMPDVLAKLIAVIQEGGTANIKLSKMAEIATAKAKRLQEKHDQLSDLLEEVQSTISATATQDPREIIKKNRVLKKKIEELKNLLEESLTGLNSKSDTNLKSLKTKSLKLKKEKNQLIRDIKAANEATANLSAKGEEKMEDLETKLKILRDFKEIADSDISTSKLQIQQQKCRNQLLAAAVKQGKQHNLALKKHLAEEAELAKGAPEEVALKRKVADLRRSLVAAQQAISGDENMDNLDGDGPADPVKFNQLKKKVALKQKEIKMIEKKLAAIQKKFEAETGAGGAKAEELAKLKEELPQLKDDVEKAKHGIKDRQEEVKGLIKKMAQGGGNLGTAVRKLKRSVRDFKSTNKDFQAEAREQVAGFGPWVQEQLARVDGLAAERSTIARKAADNYKKQYRQRKIIYKELVAKQKELGEPIEPMPETDSDSD